MAGSYAKIFNEIWADPDFRSLTRGQQWLFFALISQPELNFAGVVTTTDRRLTGCAEGFTVAELRGDLTALHARRYIVFDEEHDEILVRSYVRHDGAWRTPNVLTSIIRAATSIRSTAIRATLAEEFGRLALNELSGKRADEMRESVARVIETLRPRVSVRVSRTVSACVTEPFHEGISEPIGEPIAQPTVVVAVVVEEVEDRTSLSLFKDLPPTAGTATPRRDSNKPINAGAVIAAYMDGAKGAGLPTPAEELRGRIGKQARTLLADKNTDHEALLVAARNMGAGGWNSLAVQIQRDAADKQQNSGGNGSRFAPGTGARAHVMTAEELENEEIVI